MSTALPTLPASDPTARLAYRVLSPLEPLRMRLHAAFAGLVLRVPALGPLGAVAAMYDLVWGEIVYGGWPSSQAAMWRARQRILGDDFPAFRAVVHCRAADVEDLIERTPGALRRTSAFVAQPAQRDLLSPGTFLFTEGAGHDQHRAVLLREVLGAERPGAEAWMDARLAKWRAAGDYGPDAVEGALTACTHRWMVGAELGPDEVAAALTWQRTFFSPVMFAAPWLRSTLLRGAARRLRDSRALLEARYRELPAVRAVQGLPADELVPMLFEVLNLNAAAIQSVALRVIRVLSERPDLQERLRAEHAALGLTGESLPADGLAQADLTERLVLEVLRLHTRVTTVQWRSDAPFEAAGRRWPAGTLRCANLATANTDPAVFPEPLEIRLDRDYARFLNFNGVTSPRTCPGRGFALALLTRFAVHALR